MPRAAYDPRNVALARKAKAHGMQHALRIVIEAKRAGVPVSLAFAVAEQETGNASNVWGHDAAPNGGTSRLGGSVVTERVYHSYLQRRGRQGSGGMQGVGPYQLTWYATQDAADRLGGCWVPKHNIRTALTALGGLVKANGRRDGVRRYNGTGPRAETYATSVLARQKRWHKILTA